MARLLIVLILCTACGGSVTEEPDALKADGETCASAAECASGGCGLLWAGVVSGVPLGCACPEARHGAVCAHPCTSGVCR